MNWNNFTLVCVRTEQEDQFGRNGIRKHSQSKKYRDNQTINRSCRTASTRVHTNPAGSGFVFAVRGRPHRRLAPTGRLHRRGGANAGTETQVQHNAAQRCTAHRTPSLTHSSLLPTEPPVARPAIRRQGGMGGRTTGRQKTLAATHESREPPRQTIQISSSPPSRPVTHWHARFAALSGRLT